MFSMLSGKDGTVRREGAELLRVADWRIEKTSANKSYVANDTGGVRRRMPGVKDCSGRMEIKAISEGPAPLAEGEILAMELHVDASGENYYSLSAIVDAVRLEVDISQGTPVAYVVTFSGNGPLEPHGILSTS